MSNDLQTPKYLCKKERLKVYLHLKMQTHVTARLLKYLLIPLHSEKGNFYTLEYSAVPTYHFKNHKSKHKINIYSYSSINTPVLDFCQHSLTIHGKSHWRFHACTCGLQLCLSHWRSFASCLCLACLTGMYKTLRTSCESQM